MHTQRPFSVTFKQHNVHSNANTNNCAESSVFSAVFFASHHHVCAYRRDVYAFVQLWLLQFHLFLDGDREETWGGEWEATKWYGLHEDAAAVQESRRTFTLWFRLAWIIGNIRASWHGASISRIYRNLMESRWLDWPWKCSLDLSPMIYARG